MLPIISVELDDSFQETSSLKYAEIMDLQNKVLTFICMAYWH